MTTEFGSLLEAERDYLLRYARLQLREAHAAEDAVQETLVAALAGEASFSGRAKLRTWLTGILKHKIIDAIRRSSRDAQRPPEEGTDEIESFFDDRGHWREFPPAWSDPDAALNEKQFFAKLEECLRNLPEKAARAFMMREHMGLETAEICKELAITPTNCWVLLHRARLALRECLQVNWFGSK